MHEVDSVCAVTQIAVAETLTQVTIADVLISVLKDNKSYKQYLNAFIAIIAERKATKYSANVNIQKSTHYSVRPW